MRKRLLASGEFKEIENTVDDFNLFDDALDIAVKKFQARHGLAIDGIVGPVTRAALNVSAELRRQQILLNLERWRWLPHKWDNNHVTVNTAAFSLSAHNGNENLSMRVIVGKEYQETPVFSERMSYIEVNPYWNVPRSIAVKELLPKIKSNPAYLTRHNYQLLSRQGAVNPWHVDWQSMNSKNFPYRIRQSPGAKNALGHIKFMFPNQFNVYMHDTPDRHLFKRARRDFSHGCIRVEKPIELALLILQDDPSWTRERLEALISAGKRRVINVRSDWMVHILYWTAWVDDYGQLQFCPDLYGRDAVLWQALNRKAAGQIAR
jgi:L,D-transpeptidase YcbB